METSSDQLEPQTDPPTPSLPLNGSAQHGPWAPPTNHDRSTNGHSDISNSSQKSLDPENLPGARKSLAGISLRAFILGNALGLSSLLCVILIYKDNALWRAPFFIATLSLFHFLEYWTTAAYNTRYATISAFLLSQNGSAYNIAHTAALFECITTSIFFPNRSWLPRTSRLPLLILGLLMIIIGQSTRTIAMAQAGSNFNHTVQMKKKEGHELVTSGIYGYLRHPSYFGFFWWGLGTQVVLGNVVCFIGYAAVLWRFFNSRIGREEELLVKFFGKEYVDYRRRTWVGIPFIR